MVPILTMHHLHAQEPLEEGEGEGAEPGAAPPDAVLEPEPPADGLAKCLPLFTAGSGHRRFIRTLKPVAGTSFKARPHIKRLCNFHPGAPPVSVSWLRRYLHYMPCRLKRQQVVRVYT